MSAPELQQLAIEHGAGPESESDQAKTGSQEAGAGQGAAGDAGETIKEPSPFLVQVIAGAVVVLGGAICKRANVEPLSPDEVRELAGAAATVAAQYDLASLSPRQAAWLGLGIAVAGVTLPRVQQYNNTIEAEAEPVKAEPESSDQVGDQVGDQVAPEAAPKSRNVTRRGAAKAA